MSVTGKAEDAPRWIGCGDDDAGDADAPRFRRVFALPGGEIAEATVEIAGLGLYELHVNGRKADETRVLAPVWSHPARPHKGLHVAWRRREARLRYERRLLRGQRIL